MELRGRASRVRDLGDGTVLRIGGDPEREARLMALAARGGVRVPAVRGVRPDGLVLERITGPTLAAALLSAPWHARAAAATLAELHERVHRIPYAGATLVHRDLHPENILLAPDGPVLIDWTNAGAGEAAMDVALTWLIMETSAGLPGRALAWLFRRRVGPRVIAEGLATASAYRTADPNVSDAERSRVRRAIGR